MISIQKINKKKIKK